MFCSPKRIALWPFRLGQSAEKHTSATNIQVERRTAYIREEPEQYDLGEVFQRNKGTAQNDVFEVYMRGLPSTGG